ncbi:tetratricopeptide repeat protein [Pannus brasiliensis CCIBt3594]|uniref:protein O-GlcNAc transferase n=1 Tax=Pannus brasiliensis CCIBt3594 TaxID=1427578 RepID=A0AAW9QS53_9CHRO
MLDLETYREPQMIAIDNEMRTALDRSLDCQDYEETIALCQRAIESEPENGAYYGYLGLGYLLLGDEETATEIWMSWVLEAGSSEDLEEILTREIRRTIENGNLPIAKTLYFQLQTLQEDSPEIEKLAGESIANERQRAKEEIERENYAEATRIYENLLAWNDLSAEIWHDIGLLYERQGRYIDAFSCVVKALKIEGDRAEYHYSIGGILEKQYQFQPAIFAYQKAIELEKNFLNAYNRLGNLFYQIGQLEEAENSYRSALQIDDKFFPAYLNLANIYFVRQQWGEAEKMYERALPLGGDRPEFLENKAWFDRLSSDRQASALYSGNYFHTRKSYRSAIEYYRQVAHEKIDDINFYLCFANSYKLIGDETRALEIYDLGIKNHPRNVQIHLCKIWLLQNLRPIAEAISATKFALQLIPDSLAFRLELMRLMPIVYEKTEDIEYYRSKYERELQKAIDTLCLETREQREEALQGVSWRTNFYLQYQARNDLELQNKYGNLVYQITTATLPDRARKLAMPEPDNGKIRVGYISAHLRRHTVAKLFRGWLAYRDRQQFEVYSYSIDINGTIDDSTREYWHLSDRFYSFDQSQTIDTISRQIISDRLHILVYLDIGMDARTTPLAGLRLAPVQCVTWGHPITSGLPTIDYFLSSELMEPEDGDSHYREKLIRLPNLSIAYPKPNLPETQKTRSEMGLKEGSIVYLNCQTLFKYLPQNDDIFPRIARKVPRSQFVFIAHQSDFVTRCFEERLIKAFDSFGLNWHEYGTIVPKLDQSNYFFLNLLSDIYLDNLSWSGGNTTLEAIACHLPVVTCPGEFMRGRHSAAILRMLGIPETIARDKEQYIEIAVRLGLDPEWRQEIKNKTRQNEDRVFDDRTGITELENFYRSVVATYPDPLL